MSGRSALLLGATGATGKKVLAELLASKEWSKIGEYGRRVTALESLDVDARQRLEQRVIDFENLDAAQLNKGRWDVVFVTLGTTRGVAGSDEAFEKIDREYVVNACRAAKSDDPAHEQRVVYLSSIGADPTSRFLFSRSKGLTELALARLGYADTIVFRPAMLKGAERAERRFGEQMFGYVTSALSHFSSSYQIEIPLLAKSIVQAGLLGSSRLPAEVDGQKAGTDGAWFTLIGNRGAVALGRT